MMAQMACEFRGTTLRSVASIGDNDRQVVVRLSDSWRDLRPRGVQIAVFRPLAYSRRQRIIPRIAARSHTSARGC